MKMLGTAFLLSVIPYQYALGAGMAHNDNFVVYAPDQTIAEQVREKADEYRRAISNEWLGDELPPSVGSTIISVRFSDKKDEGLTWVKDYEEAKYHNVYLVTTPDRALGSTLAHEIVHAVLATQFKHPNRLPIWVEEGIAARYDDDQRKRKRAKILSWYARSENWPKIVPVLDAKKIHPNDQESYTISASLTQFLIDRGTKRKFVQFAAAAREDGWDRSLNHYYDLNGIADLQSSWQRWLLQSHANPTLAMTRNLIDR